MGVYFLGQIFLEIPKMKQPIVRYERNIPMGIGHSAHNPLVHIVSRYLQVLGNDFDLGGESNNILYKYLILGGVSSERRVSMCSDPSLIFPNLILKKHF